MPVYNKLIRDRIPETIEQSGKRGTVRKLEDATYLTALNVKLDEELAEYHEADEARALEELADLLEVLRAITTARDFTLEQLESACAEKAAKRGGFAKKLWLEEVIKPADQFAHYVQMR